MRTDCSTGPASRIATSLSSSSVPAPPSAVGASGPDVAQALDRASARLRAKIELASAPLAHACETLFEHDRLAELLPEYFIEMHTVIRATVPLLELSARTAAAAEDDPVAAGAAPYLAEHAEEERHHDEWLLEDLELIGVDRRAVLERVPSPAVARLVGAQYYWVLHYHPVAILGYLSLMEGSPPSNWLIDHLIEKSGFPREFFRTYALHGELDAHHLEELDEAIDALPLRPEHEVLLGLSAISSAELLTRIVEEVVASA
jgi:Iron-containing redox enzyme